MDRAVFTERNSLERQKNKIFLVFVIFLAVYNFQGQELLHKNPTPKTNQVSVVGEVSDIKIAEENNSSVVFSAKIKFRIINDSTESVLFLRDFLQFQADAILLENESKEMQIISSTEYPPSFSNSKYWLEIGNKLSKGKLDEDLIIKLDSKKSLEKEDTRLIYIDKKNQNLIGPLNHKKKLYLQFKVKLWQDEIRTKQFSGKDFENYLRKKWFPIGNLQINILRTEPILLDLSSAVVKTDSKP